MHTGHKHRLKHFVFAISLLAVVVMGTTQPMMASLYSVAFKTNNPAGNTPLVSGPEAAATAANAAFGAANVWNNLLSPWALETNPSWSGLVDSTGATTGLSFAITGTVAPVDFQPWIPTPDPLRSASLNWNSWISGGGGFGAGESTSVSWVLTGLAPNATYDMFVYGGIGDTNRSFDMTIQGTTLNIPTYSDFSSHPLDGVLFASLYTNAGGTISGLGTGLGSGLTAANEANWSGFQIVEVSPTTPEPTSLILLGSGAIGLAGAVRRKLRG